MKDPLEFINKNSGNSKTCIRHLFKAIGKISDNSSGLCILLLKASRLLAPQGVIYIANIVSAGGWEETSK